MGGSNGVNYLEMLGQHRDTHTGPPGANLPLTTDLQLTGGGGFRPLQVSTVPRVHVDSVVAVNLATENLAVLHAWTTGPTTL